MPVIAFVTDTVASDHYGGTLSFDLKSSVTWAQGPLLIIGSATFEEGPERDPTICFTGGAAPGTSYTTYNFVLDPSQALADDCTTPATPQQIVAILSDFKDVTIDGEDNLTPGMVTSLDNVTYGQTVVFKSGYTIAAGKLLYVNSATRAVTADGVSSPWLIDAQTTSWWELQPGPNTIRISGSTYTAGQTLLRVQFREARI
jgi:hypothetical protein